MPAIVRAISRQKQAVWEVEIIVKQALADALEAQGYETLTAVQEACTDPALIGKDLLVSAQTGSGKTVGFGLAIGPQLLGEAETFGQADAPLALIIAPTRELALQVKRELAWLFGKANAVIASTVGGMDMRDERRALGRGAHIVVSTPGRLRDHIMRGSIDLNSLKAVVLDEADEMLDLGFREDLEFILDAAPADRQTLMFSATVPAAIAKLAQNFQNDAVRIATTSGASQHADISYRAFNVAPRDTENAIINVLRYYEAPNAIVFCNTRATVNRMTTRLSNRGFSVVALSGELSQQERTNALQSMRDGRARVCVATDVAARGIDLPNLELVIHAELPTNQDTLLHRSGRTGRAGRKGISALIVPPAARKKAERLMGWAKVRADWSAAPSADEVTAMDDERMMASSDWTGDVEDANRAAVAQLSELYTPEQLAAAYVRLYRERRSAPEELSDAATAAPEPRKAFGPSVWFSLAGGRGVNAEPRRLLPMLCKMGNVTREDIGAIRIQEDASLIEIKEGSVAGFLKAIGPDMVLEDGAILSKMASPPAQDRERRGPPHKPDRKPHSNKSASRKPDMYKAAPAAPAKPYQAAKPADAPKPVERPRASSSKPVVYDDASEPKRKKPKGGKPPAGKPAFAKPGAPQSGPKPKREVTTAGDRGAEEYKPRKPRHKSGAANPGESMRAGGAKPPQGKPSSKKNRARQAVKAAEGGNSKPRRPKNRA